MKNLELFNLLSTIERQIDELHCSLILLSNKPQNTPFAAASEPCKKLIKWKQTVEGMLKHPAAAKHIILAQQQNERTDTQLNALADNADHISLRDDNKDQLH